jgi:hypothetical protein
MRLRGDLQIGRLAPLAMSYEALPGQPAVATVQGRVQIRESLAEAAVTGWTQPYDLTEGAIGLNADLRLPPNGTPQGRIQIDLEGVSGYYGEYRADAVSAELDLRSAAAGWSLGPTPVRIARLATGVDLDNVRSGLAWSGAAVELQPTTADLLGGTLHVAPFTYHLDSGSGSTEVGLADLDLARILALEGEHIAGSGTLEGVLPVRFENAAPSVDDGTVHAKAPGGVIRVAPALTGVTGQPGLDFALRALQDFRFKVLEADVDYSAAGDLALAVRLQGSNPDIEGGRPIHYNLNVSENVPTLLRALRLQDDVTRGVERRMNN